MRVDFVSFEVSKLDTSILVRDAHPSNKDCISVTFEVLNPVTSMLARELQPENIFDILVTFDVSKLDKLMLVNE